tara:strand:+ start:131 stop:265 length:135 start_codon:yes stop_codon:yes gene_type:complete
MVVSIKLGTELAKLKLDPNEGCYDDVSVEVGSSLMFEVPHNKTN